MIERREREPRTPGWHLTAARLKARIGRSMEFKRLFTPQEAESALPLVRQIVADILETARRIRELDENER